MAAMMVLGTTAAGSAKVKLTLMGWAAPPEWIQTCKEFNRLNPDIEVVAQGAGWPTFFGKLPVSFAGGVAPDMFWRLPLYGGFRLTRPRASCEPSLRS